MATIEAGCVVVFNHKLLSVVQAASRVSRWVDLRPIIVTCALLASLIWQFSVPVLANTPCGLITPHEHILIGQADDSDLEEHLAAEAKCALGKPDAPDKQAAELRGSKGRILNVIQSDSSQTSHPTMLHDVIAALPTLTAIQPFRSLYSRWERLHLLGQSVVIPPPKPPPKAAYG